MKVSLVIQQERELTTVIARLREMLKEGRRVHVRGDFYTPKRSTAQNSTLHLWLGEISEQTGHTTEEIKEILKSAFLPRAIIKVGDIETLRPVSTTQLNKHQMYLFMERVQAWAAEFGFILTQPEPDILRAWRIEAEQEQADCC